MNAGRRKINPKQKRPLSVTDRGRCFILLFRLSKEQIRTRPRLGRSSDFVLLVEEGGFEPPKRNATDLQSAPFGHSGTPPYFIGAGGRIRTPDLLITNQLLYRLSYTSAEVFRIHSGAYYNSSRRACQPFFQKNSKIQKGEEMAAHGILEPSTPGGAAVLPVRGGALPRRPLFRAGQPGGMRGLPGAVCPAVFRRAAAPGGPGAAAAAATLFLRQRSTRENL